MKLHHLKPAPGARTPKARMGRGRAGKRGKTGGRGTKGWGARHNPRQGFEGGQMPLARRLPKKKGFTNPNREDWAVVNVARIAERFSGSDPVTPEAMAAAGLVRKRLPVKVLGNGEIGAALTIHAHAFSQVAKEKIEGAGGRVEVLGAS